MAINQPKDISRARPIARSSDDRRPTACPTDRVGGSRFL